MRRFSGTVGILPWISAVTMNS